MHTQNLRIKNCQFCNTEIKFAPCFCFYSGVRPPNRTKDKCNCKEVSYIDGDDIDNLARNFMIGIKCPEYLLIK